MAMQCDPEKCPLSKEVDRLCRKIEQFLQIWRYSVPIKLVALLMLILAASLGVSLGVHNITESIIKSAAAIVQ